MSNRLGPATSANPFSSAGEDDRTSLDVAIEYAGHLDTWKLLVTSVTGGSFDKELQVVDLVQRRLRRLLDTPTRAFVLSLMHIEFYPQEGNDSRIVHLISKVMNILRDRPRMHIANIVIELLAQKVCQGSLEDPATIRSIKRFVFASLGWTTGLYLPDLASTDHIYAILNEGSTCFEKVSVDSEAENIPIITVIREFGSILPTQTRWDIQYLPSFSISTAPNTGPNILHTASLNIDTLSKVGKLRIDWIESLSSHLDFDTAHMDPITGTITPVVKLFRYPSLCYQHSVKNSLIDGLLEDWYDEDSKPPKFTTKGLMQEILLSYNLLVLFDGRARKYFIDTTKNMSCLSDYDEELDRLCLGAPRNEIRRKFWFKPKGFRETFYATYDFPILSSRLSKIQGFIDSIQPNGIHSLWNDRRDMLRWYTFWAVLILGSINIAVALLQAALTAEQVRLARVQG
ncbi:hypothetical protein F4805DRAFT_461270 [Annulohypoxylon moriforme]|nr:hypothetical protein F4805DRAFT_461270 [Annulohypoxylon moriforme]